MSTEAAIPNPIALLGSVTNRVKEVVAGVQQSQIDGPTPCSEWDVHGLINNLLGGLEFAAGSMAGNPPSSLPPIALILGNATLQTCPKPIAPK